MRGLLNRFRSYIASFLALLFSAGLLFSTLHIHELAGDHVSPPFDTEHVLELSHDTCPFCAIVFEGVYHIENSDIYTPENEEITPILSNKVTTQPVLFHKNSRSPPVYG